MTANPTLSENEWQLVLQLLQQERRELGPEIHHTDNPGVHDDLKNRIVLVDSLIDKLQRMPVSC